MLLSWSQWRAGACRRFLERAGEPDGEDCWAQRLDAIGDVGDQFQARSLVVAAPNTDVGDGDFGLRVGIVDGRRGVCPIG